MMDIKDFPTPGEIYRDAVKENVGTLAERAAASVQHVIYAHIGRKMQMQIPRDNSVCVDLTYWLTDFTPDEINDILEAVAIKLIKAGFNCATPEIAYIRLGLIRISIFWQPQI